ncbi:MAG: aminotransferase class I/II-fold pyridoxal phosphate-dependent enzyme [Lachnospiraceae bacterium]|nr:aminotransferase class I/II-fold pyridoxal phosphate-dependent enzyme [Lachnospiraceae bacterium]MCM1239878.1 aminotransferase class I/II-fold pyridoxal phosphate-dependent enzyme [Lachnospiraceae bacterium]MCM1304524.1 aminotransferase class I/II-fold pyridoxal phosphate-dependent enzyme [Butyrivibrio sp.]MCM1343956.1 aminotransferase class I/II-fold pyridoxal phosphate-dependent enzyme [Muribaculaceae bacterium]MCM1411438.1 aminotransferase class I/II-fold pyridoxal phosphate-dependent enz
MEHLFDKLEEYGRSDIYPCHMPGHKRRPWGKLPEEMFLRDITEIDGFDNLHQPEGILRELQEQAAALYGAEESFYLVNGSTSGILSAVSAALPEGGYILMARNCHKAAYHAAYLRNLTVSYLYPPLMAEYDIMDGISSQQVEEALEREPAIGAVLIVSPTYEGRISDIRRIAETVHKRNIPLIVDEAHGAHLGFSADLAENSCRAGADLVIHSVHKTLPALTQTALLHVNGNRVDRALLRRFLHIYQSSSPSYLLMASIDNALQYVEKAGAEAFAAFAGNYRKLLADLAACKHLRFLPLEREKQDIGKLLISTKMTNMSGKGLYDILLKRYHIQLEMAAETYALAMFTVNDAEEGYERMRTALLQIDGEMDASEEAAYPEELNPEAGVGCPAEICPVGTLHPVPLACAWDMKKRYVELQDSVDQCAGGFVELYPPGIPLLVPGERITAQLAEDIRRYLKKGLNVQGLRVDERSMRICILEKE